MVTEDHMIATGARPHMPGLGCRTCDQLERGVSSRRIAQEIIIAGGGYIANEFAGIFNEFGSEVHIVNTATGAARL